jgi:hypothetical protein
MKYKDFNTALRWGFASLALIWVAGCIFATTAVSSGGYYRVFGFWIAPRTWEGSADWVADKGELALIGLLLIGLVFVIVNAISRVALGQSGDSTLNKALRVASKLTIVAIFLFGVALPIYDMTFTVLAKANRAFLKGDTDRAWKLYKKAVELELDVGNAAICDSSYRPDINRCLHLQVLTTEKHIEGLSYPKVTDHVWTVNNESISPLCMETIWMSGDNYEEYEERYPQAENFRFYPGQYWGSLIPIDPINASWGKLLSLPKDLKACNKIKPKDFTSIEENVFSHDVQDDSSVQHDSNKYTLLAEWGREGCSKVIPQLADQCQSLAFVKIDTTYKYLDIAFNSYAHITDKGKAYIVPVTNGMPLGDLLKLIEDN